MAIRMRTLEGPERMSAKAPSKAQGFGSGNHGKPLRYDDGLKGFEFEAWGYRV